MHHRTIEPPALGECNVWQHLDRFLEHLREREYSRSTISGYGSILRRICHATEAGAYRLEDPDGWIEGLIPEAATARSRDLWRTAARRFAGHLVATGAVTPPTVTMEPSRLDDLRAAYRDWLVRQRGMAQASVRNNLVVFDGFMRFRFGDDAVRPEALTPAEISAFFDPGRMRPYRGKPSRMRNLLRFLFQSGRTPEDLSVHVPRDLRRRAEVPRLQLSGDEVRRVIDAANGDSPLAVRNHAMLLLAARLGLRAGEVTAVRLEDIRWRTGEIRIRGKGARRDPMPLPVDVGEALVRHVRHAGRGKSAYLFVSVRAPWGPLGTSVVGTALSRAIAAALPERRWKRCGFHVLRHSLATSLLRQGARFEEVGNVLRHRSCCTTMIHARYDIDALRPLARDWPAEPGAER